MRPSATRPRKPGIYLPLGVAAHYAHIAVCRSGAYSFTLNSLDGRPAARPPTGPPFPTLLSRR